MESTILRVSRAKPGFGYMNRILRIDLSSMTVHSQDSSVYLPDFLGGRGLAIKIAWDEYPTPIDPFDPDNPLMIFPAALTGTRSPYNGRTSVCAFSPQSHPHNWFTRSNIGGWIGGNIKRAGYDGIIITGKADQPVRVRVVDDEITVLPADDLWGVDALDTLEELTRLEGNGSKSLVIGQAGERLSRIATIQTASSSACGQGGFGAVMGSKNLKAITVTGSYDVRAADPDGIRFLSKQVAKAAKPPKWATNMFGKDIKELNEELAKKGDGTVRLRACTEGCLTPCYTEYHDMPGSVHKRKWTGSWICVAMNMIGRNSAGNQVENCPDDGTKDAFDFRLDRRAGFEMNVLTNRYGLNQFELLEGIIPWLISCQKAGLINELNGVTMDWYSPVFWDTFLHAIAYREGIGDALAEGAIRAAQILNIGEDLVQRFYPGWGQSGHWDGHTKNNFAYPYWIPTVLQWMSDTRDPFNSGHGSMRTRVIADQMAGAETKEERERILAAAQAWGKQLYGTGAAADPYSGYEGKAEVGFFHTIRPVIKDCVPVDDLTFPLTFDPTAPDYRIVLQDSDGGEFDGADVEYRLFCLGTGAEWSRDEFEAAAARVYTLERALLVRHWGRDRSLDETTLPYFENLDTYQSPLLEQRYGLDREQFKPVLDKFYSLHGWDPETGWPTKDGLEALGLNGVYDQMIEGARRGS
jgi:aldehyde:ferredoxin oxidoreductase